MRTGMKEKEKGEVEKERISGREEVSSS